jgi:two-component system cell cycle sensor histidine kinase/response regulator CckA
VTRPADASGPASHGEVLLLLSDAERAALLADMLSRSRTVTIADHDEALDGRFDIAIVDGPVLQRLWRRVVERKRADAPTYLPFLLVTTPADVGLFARFLWTAVDELIHAPIQAPELLARVDVLLRAREASRKLRDHSEERFRRYFDHDPAGQWVAAADGRLLQCNAAFAAIVGATTSDEAARRTWTDLLPDPAEAERLLGRLARGERIDAQEFTLRRADGTLREVLLSAAARVEEGRVTELQGSMVDVTQRRTAEQRYWLGQRLETVGQLAGGIAHNYNNMLSAILGYADLLLADLPLGDPRRHDVDEIRKAALRSAELTRQLLAFSRQQVLQPVELNLNEVVGGMERALRSAAGAGVMLRVGLDPALPAVVADRSQVEQVLLNLVLNARDAMPEGGELTVTTERLHLAAPDRSHRGVEIPAGTYAILNVRDSGVGMDAETRARAFEPFFTTKPPGVGTGLGLPTAYGIVKQSGGFIWVDSAPGHGTTVRIYLPEGRPAVAAADPPRAPDRGPGERAGETVLLVEDEDAVRVMAARILRQRGYAVLEAGDGSAALAALAAHVGPLDILVTDVVMPGMDGVELAREVTRLRPEARVLFVSGYAQRDALKGLSIPSPTLVQKPFRIGELVGAIRKLLGPERADRDPGSESVRPTDAA